MKIFPSARNRMSMTDRLRIISARNCEKIDDYLKRIPRRWALALQMYHGLNGPALSFREIGIRLGVTRQRAQQLRDQARRQIRKMAGEL